MISFLYLLIYIPKSGHQEKIGGDPGGRIAKTDRQIAPSGHRIKTDQRTGDHLHYA